MYYLNFKLRNLNHDEKISAYAFNFYIESKEGKQIKGEMCQNSSGFKLNKGKEAAYGKRPVMINVI